MTKQDVEFDTWFEQLCEILADEGVSFSDADAVEMDYEDGKSVFDVAQEIKDEYSAG